jgi:hypothetical protein
VSDDKTEPDSGGAAPVGPAAPAPDDKDMTLIAPPKPAKAKKPAKGAKGAKGGKGKSKGKGKGGKSGASLASHPKAHAQIRAAKGWGGLVGFTIAAYLSYQAQVPFDQIGLRAIAAGLAGYMVAWAFAVTFWRYLLLAEIRVLAEQQRNPPPTAGAAAGAAQGSPAAVAPPGAAD